MCGFTAENIHVCIPVLMQMPAKNRGKSAAASDQINLLNVNADSVLLPPPPSSPSASPLKIESVVPRRAQNPSSRFLQRSYSTLNLRYLNTSAGGEAQRKNGIDRSIKKHTIRNGNRALDSNAKQTHENGIQMVKTISPPSPSRLSPAQASQPPSSAAIASHSASGNVQHCGFWRIQRTTKEKEKFPDRINLDRRGLATLPLIVDEPNLRLLSLQHNLINSICVPAAGTSPSPSSLHNNNRNNHEEGRDNSSLITAVEFAKKSDNAGGSKSAKVSSTNGGGRQHRLLRTQSIQKPSSSSSSSRTLSRNFSINSTFGRNRLTTTKTIDPNHQSATATAAALINSETGSANATAPKSSLVPKSALLHSKEKYVLKKANSVVNSYSKHLGRLIQNRNNGTATAANAKLALGSSFSSDSTQDIDIQPPIEMLMIKNDPFNGFAQCLQNLVFLDLTDNQIERISCLDGLTSLTVLLLGKNRINDISGVTSVKATLRVLDLHGNKITTIAQKICQLHELKSLNLAANNLRQIHEDDFKGLAQLKELNIKRNRIKKLNGFNDLHALERLWMCHNDIEKVCHLWCVKKAINLREITIENNPVSLAGDCISFLVSHLKRLTTFNKMTVTEQVRRAAMDWRKNRELYDSNHSELSSDIRREEIISNARTNWELLRSQQPPKSLNYNQKAINGTRTSTTIAAATAAAAAAGPATAAAAVAAALNDADVESNLSNLSENVIIDRKVIRHKTQMIRKNLRKSIKMKRSVSQDNASSTNIANEFRLPPIAATIISEANAITESLNASASSIGVNIDSASSHFISETEELAKSCEELARIGTLGNGTIELNQSTSNGIAIAITANGGEIFNQNENGNESDGVPAAIMQAIDNSPQQSEKASSSPNSSLNSEKDAIAAKVDSGETTVAINLPLEKSATLQRTKSMVKRSCHHPILQRSQTARVINLISPVPTTAAAAAASTSTNVTVVQTPKPSRQLDREREQGGDYLIEICGRYLNVYGSGAIKFIDRQWNAQKANDVHTLKFSYANFNSVATIFGKIKNRFPNAEHFAFRETNIQYLGQLNALAELQGLTSVTLGTEGNPICSKDWRSYAVYRLAHWGIKLINDVEVKKEEIDAAQIKYAGLSDLVLWSLPESTIEPLLMRLHLDESCSNVAAEKIKPKQWLMCADLSLRSVVGKEALQCKLSASHQFVQENEIRNRGRQCLAEMIENTCNAVEKLQKLETMWPSILLDLVKSTLLDYAQMDAYIEMLMTELNSNSTK